jgi:hypothetical protein
VLAHIAPLAFLARYGSWPDGPEAYLHVNFSKIARFALARLQLCEKLARPRRRRSPSLAPSIASEFVAR